jgi:gluconolactonase
MNTPRLFLTALLLAAAGCSSNFSSKTQPASIVGGAKGAVTAGPPVKLDAANAGEGPAWVAATGRLLYVGNNRISSYHPTTGSTDLRNPVKGANGLLLDREGRLVCTEAGNRIVTRTNPDGSIQVLARQFSGKPFNSPNDVSIDSKGRLYFTDPRYGQRGTMEQRDAAGQRIEGVYRIDPEGSVARILGRDSVDRPNGILVSPDEKTLYVADNNNTEGGTRKLWRFDLRPDGSVDSTSRTLVFDWKTSRGPDGLKIDSTGLLFVAAGLNADNPPHETAMPYPGGIYVLTREGRLREFIPIPTDEVTNCAFGGPDLRTLYITAGGSLWSVPLRKPGLGINH